MKNNKPTIGLEVHIELSTKSKMFCSCPAFHFDKKPNTQTCPVCLGLPGALPVPNKKAVEYTILLAIALKCKINRSTKFDRKHYFYPDLPKGYQISQYDEPIGVNGFLDTSFGRVRIRRVHLEEDTGKLKHKVVNNEKISLIDFNRGGVPLVEIVSEPDIKSSEQAKEYTKELQNIVRTLEISSCDMEKGSMRLEANISLGKNLGYKVEVKNLNSHKFVKMAIDYELERQKKIVKRGETPVQETRGWSETKCTTTPQRIKESEADYRYFPEPDIPPIEFSESYLHNLRLAIPKLPDEISQELVKKYKIKKNYAQIISLDNKYYKFIQDAAPYLKKNKVDINNIADFLINKKIDIRKETPSSLIEKLKDKVTNVIRDEIELKKFSKQALSKNPDVVQSIKRGNLNAIQVLVGWVMKATNGKADPVKTKVIIEKLLNL